MGIQEGNLTPCRSAVQTGHVNQAYLMYSFTRARDEHNDCKVRAQHILQDSDLRSTLSLGRARLRELHWTALFVTCGFDFCTSTHLKRLALVIFARSLISKYRKQGRYNVGSASLEVKEHRAHCVASAHLCLHLHIFCHPQCM
mmetsp:Transcript_97487/g.172629  ORF Transcript_97487/g.172629 Transcript_97487/m.172629 type:complete len:143 (-) Transcript_97487:350-778(-)